MLQLFSRACRTWKLDGHYFHEPFALDSSSFAAQVLPDELPQTEFEAEQICTLGLFQDSDFAGDFEDSKSTSGGVLCILEAEHLSQ